jgi:hypothetical protein
LAGKLQGFLSRSSKLLDRWLSGIVHGRVQVLNLNCSWILLDRVKRIRAPKKVL